MISAAPSRLQAWLDGYSETTAAAAPALDAAVAFAKAIHSGPPGLRAMVLEILEDLEADTTTLAAAVVFLSCADAGDLTASWRARLGQPVCELVDELFRLREMHALKQTTDAEGLRRLLLAIIKDLRVVLVVLAEQLARLRLAADAPTATREELAERNLSLYAPLANRLGIWQLKWQLEDWAFRYQQPDTYKRIACLLDARRAEREGGIAKVIGILKTELERAEIQGKIKGRPKHIYSIWNKMQRKGVSFEELYDVRAVRVLVDDVVQCYAVLGIAHEKFHPVPGEFDDYIATPKPNQYQSLHTAVIGPDGRALEIQIRTHAMHQHAELGVAAHWRYKEGGGRDAAYERKLAWMRRLLEGGGGEELLEQFHSEVGEERVYALTPRGKVLDLIKGATVLDFAYLVHTDIGHRCRGAKVNGRIVPLTYTLKSGDQVEILTAKTAAPSRDWMVSALGFLATARARQKVRQWFRKADYSRNRDAGRAQVERELGRLGLKGADLTGAVARFNFVQVDDLYAAIGSGDVTPAQVANVLDSGFDKQLEPRIPRAPDSQSNKGEAGVLIEGVGRLLHQLARCCKPVPHDPIVGYITRGRGITVHRSDCRNVMRARRETRPQLIEVAWAGDEPALYAVDIAVQAYERKNLMHDISGILTHFKLRVEGFNSRLDAQTSQVDIRCTVLVENIEQLSSLLQRLAALPNIIDVKRVMQ